MKYITILILCLFLLSCKTYERVVYLDSWTDKWNTNYQVICIKTYTRKNDSLVAIRIDTLKTDKVSINESDIFTK